ncbi:MBL fold metallo-hydrolase [Pleionea sediminis]|uniref:MBL fold metallo-hydrolase n=1 Tax=Pleionea sediminis TaxID=2569479 RepID=UPI0011870A40|nr:MBL fold metallo-hydrolase [Pleionea sediminis]
MKKCHNEQFYCWSEFNPERDIDFHSYVWVREQGNVVFDPLSISLHDLKHLQSLGGADYVVITNSDHIRDAKNIATILEAKLVGPKGEKDTFPIECDHWIGEGDNLIEGMQVFEMHGSKTPGELALLIENTTLITGDLIRSHQGGSLCMLPYAKLTDKQAAMDSVNRLKDIESIETVLVGDGWPVFNYKLS